MREREREKEKEREREESSHTVPSGTIQTHLLPLAVFRRSGVFSDHCLQYSSSHSLKTPRASQVPPGKINELGEDSKSRPVFQVTNTVSYNQMIAHLLPVVVYSILCGARRAHHYSTHGGSFCPESRPLSFFYYASGGVQGLITPGRAFI